MSDTLEAFAASVDTKAFKVVHSPSLIFLCGGSLDEKSGRPPSVRSVFYERLKKKRPEIASRVLLAETACKWYEFTRIYPNLLELEEQIAGLSALILLFVESPGSIAELGAFSEVKPLRDKLVTIVEENHYNSKSFIKEGPLTLLEKNKSNSVRAYPWFMKRRRVPTLNLRLCTEAAQRIEEQLSNDVKEHSGEQSFSAHDHGGKIQPLLARFTNKVVASLLGVSIPYASAVRAGRRRPHPRHWQTLAELANFSPEVQ